MRICLVHEEYPEETNFGGIATYQKELAEQYVKMGHEVYVICRGLKESYQEVTNGVNIIRIHVEQTSNEIDNYKKYREKVRDELLKLQSHDKIDIIEVPDWGAETVLFEKYRKIPLVVRLHTPLKVWLKYNNNNFGQVKDQLLSWEEEMLLSADVVTCCSNALKNIIVDEFDLEEDDIIVTPNPANIVNFFRDENIEKEEKLIFVGSLEERKGVFVLANALNLVFEKYPNLKIIFIGKDTNRNVKNYSTKQIITEMIDEKYRDNVEFTGQLPNVSINDYLNAARVAIFPSLFDNFPYVTLEAMATGIEIVGSSNSGMVEMLDDEQSIYNTGDYVDLAKKIIYKYEISKNQLINTKNIERVKKLYNSYNVSSEMINIYNVAINEYYKREFQEVLKYIDEDSKVIYFSRENDGVANNVYRVITENNTYIIKNYNYDYNFDLSERLYKIYEKNDIKVIKPLNDKVINYKNKKYNIFEYKNNDMTVSEVDVDYLCKILCCDRICDQESELLKKCLKYFDAIKEEIGIKKLPSQDLEFVVNNFTNIQNSQMFNEQYINHGDLSCGNIICSNNEKYIIDFDETVVTSKLYDFAVIVIKMFYDEITKDINIEKYNALKDRIKKIYTEYNDEDFKKIIQFYLCKILLEKFYLYKVNKIDLFSFEQQKDPYVKYLSLLRDVEKRL